MFAFLLLYNFFPHYSIDKAELERATAALGTAEGADMEDNVPYTAEYSVDRRKDPKLKRMKAAIILGYVTFSVVFFAILYRIAFIPVFALTPFLLLIAHMLLWRYTNPEYIYSFRAGTLTFSVKYDRRQPRALAEFDVRRSAVGRASESDCGANGGKLLDLRSSPTSPDGFYIKCDGVCVLFDATRNLIRMMSHFNPDISAKDMPRF